MASLTHVCVWSEQGWKPITASEASRIHPNNGGVSYRSGLFRCDLCGQYVTLTKEGSNVSHFRHSSDERSQDCPDRAQASATISSFQSGIHSLPLRLCGITNSSFELQIGMLPIPEELYPEVVNSKITISGKNSMRAPIEYLGARIEQGGTTYLSLGTLISETYLIHLSCRSKAVREIWPAQIDGISRDGVLFDRQTGKKLPPDADVNIHCTYLLLTARSIYCHHSIEHTKICEHRIGFDTWKIYEIKATAFSEEAARFFMDYHCRLTEYPVMLFPIWPPCVEKPYVLLHARKQIALYLHGYSVSLKSFPSSEIRIIGKLDEDEKVYQMSCKERQQLLSAGRTRVLKYTYLWQDNLTDQAATPQVVVRDLRGKIVESGVLHTLPEKRLLVIESQYDGKAEVTSQGNRIRRYILKADRKTDVEVQYGYEIAVFQGLDKVLTFKFVRPDRTNAQEEDQLLQKLTRSKGRRMIIPHELGSVADKLKQYPKVKQWLYQQIRRGSMTESAYLLLLETVRTNTVREGKT